MLFGFPRQNINHSSETFKVIYVKHCLFHARINYQFKTSELKNVKKLVEETLQALWSCYRMDMKNKHFFTMCEITFLVSRWSLKIECGS